MPHKGEFARPPAASSASTADNLIAKLRIQKAAIRKDGANLDDVEGLYAKWKTEAQNEWDGLEGIDRRRVKAEQGQFEAKLEAARKAYRPKPSAQGIDPDTGEVMEAAE